MAKRILIVDDEPNIVEIITYILDQEGYETRSLFSGNDVFNCIKEFQPDLLLMDVMLGDMDGRDICKRIKSDLKKPPVILISASHDLKHSLLSEGAPDNFIAKPFDITNLLDIVELYCSEKQ